MKVGDLVKFKKIQPWVNRRRVCPADEDQKKSGLVVDMLLAVPPSEFPRHGRYVAEVLWSNGIVTRVYDTYLEVDIESR